MAAIAFEVNGGPAQVADASDTPLLWVLRDTLGLKGTKFGCGVGACGICVVLVDGEPRKACLEKVSAVAGKHVVTIEGIGRDPQHPVIRAWIEEQVPQCGYCQPGQVVAATWLLQRHPQPTDAQVDDAMSHVLCRCGTYQRVRRAVQRAATLCATDAAAPAPAETPAAPAVREQPAPFTAGRGRLRPLLDAHGRFAPGPWVRIDRDGMVTVIIDRSEMGQGIVTSLATLVAEELEVGLHQIRTELAPAAPEYVNPLLGEQMTGGSTSVRAAWKPLREAGAIAREMLVSAAAKIWGVKRGECQASEGQVLHAHSGRRLGYGELVMAAASLPLPRTPTLKKAEQFRLIGRSLPRLEVPDMVIGRTQYGIDVALPDMLYAVVLRCPVFGGRVSRFDASAASRLPGIRAVLPIDSGIAVVADSAFVALQARDTLQVEWDRGPNATLDSAAIDRRLRAALSRRGTVVRDDGDVARSLRRAARVVEAEYATPYLAHGTMEPMNCVAHVRSDACDVWVGTQAQEGAQARAMGITGLPREQVHVHASYLGGGFGRRLEHDFVGEAVQLSKATARPVQVLWTRSDDLQHDFYRPANVTGFKAGLDGSDQPIAWLQRVAGPALALDGIEVVYAIPNLREVDIEEDPGIPTGPWRSVGASQNAFAIECFVDELASEAGQDPVAFRRALLAHSLRHRAVLELAAERCEWGRPLPKGQARGVAVYASFGSWVAQVAEVSVAADGSIRVHRVVCAVDCGSVVNPDTVAAQMEGAVVFGLSAALYGQITIRDGAVEQSSFEDYPILALRAAPTVEVHIVRSARSPGGVGEPGVPPIAPAVANAVFAATGVRMRRLPLARVARTAANP